MNKFRHALYSYQNLHSNDVIKIPVVMIGCNKSNGVCIWSRSPIPGGWSTDFNTVQSVMRTHGYKLFDELTGQDLKTLNFDYGKFVSMTSLEDLSELNSIVLDINQELNTKTN